MTNVNFAMEVHGFGEDFIDGRRLVDDTAVRVRLDPLNTGSRDRRRNVSDLKNSMQVGGVVSVERWHLQGAETGCYYAGFLHLLNGSPDNTEERSLHSAMTRPGMPYVGAANHKQRAYVDILFNKNSAVVQMKSAKERILTSYLMNDFSLGNPFVLLRDPESPQKKIFQLPVCYKVKCPDGRWVRPGKADLLKSLNSDKYSRFPRLMKRLADRSDSLEVVAGVRAQVSSALASDSRYLALLNQVYTAEVGGKTVPNYRGSMVSFKKHTSKGSEDYYLSYLAPTLADPRQPNLAGLDFPLPAQAFG